MDENTFQQAVDAHYESLYRFALSLAHREADASDLTQETFRKLATHGHRLRDESKIKTWLFTTLYRRFVSAWRRSSRYQQVELEDAAHELPSTQPQTVQQADAHIVRAALDRVDEIYRIPLILFYLDEHSYLEIAQILGVPCGTVMSRISRGRGQLRQLLLDHSQHKPARRDHPLEPAPDFLAVV